MLCCLLEKLSQILHCDQCEIRMVPRLSNITEQSSSPTRSFQHRLSSKGKLLMAFSMTGSQQVDCKVEFKDKKGNPAKVDGVPAWSVDNSDILSVTPAADGLSAVVAAMGPLGTANVQVNADADLGAGIVEIIGLLECTITAGQATVVNITPGTPSEQP